MKKSWKNLLIGSFMLLGVAGMSAERPPEKVVGGVVESIPVEIGRRYIGKVSAVDDVSLVARVSGTILQQCFASGDEVKKDQLLFVIEDTTYKAAVDSAKARLAQSKADLKRCEAEVGKCKAELVRLKAEAVFANKELERNKKLWKDGKDPAIAETVYDEAVRKNDVAVAAVKSMEVSIVAANAAVEAARATVDAAQAALDDAENNLSYTKIKAPFNGKAGIAPIGPYNYVTPASGALIYIVNMDSMNVNFWISMRDYISIFGGNFERLKNEAHVTLMLADGSEFKGEKKIILVDNKVDKDTDTIRVRLRVKNDGMVLLPDSLVSVRISKKDPAKTAVPASAIVTQGKQSFVYVIDENNIARIRPVVLGDMQGNKQIITSGLKDGEKIVVDGTHKVIFGLAASEAGQPVAL